MAKKKVDNFQEGVTLELDGAKYQPILNVTKDEKAQETEQKQPAPTVSVEATATTNPRLVKRQESADAYLNNLAAKEKELGRALTQQEIADWDDAKGLWAYQAINNKKGNLANAFGGTSVFGKLNNDTYSMLRRDLDERMSQSKKQDAKDNKFDRVVAVVPMTGGSTRAVTRGQQIAHQNLGNTITDVNNLSPEQANALVGILRKDHAIPEDIKFDSTTTLANVLDTLDDYVSDEEFEALGYYDNNMNVTVPHKETYEEMMARREKAEEAMRLQSQQKALARQQARLGLADLAAGIGDIIKASGGALVDRRDYKNMYDQLTAQQQTNFNNYLARMEALKQEEKAKQRLAEERAYQQAKRDEERAYAEGQQKKAWEREDDVIAQKHANELEKIRARGKNKLNEIAQRNKNQIEKFNNNSVINFEKQKYTFDKASSNNVVSSLLGVIRHHFNEENGYLDMLAGIDSSIMSEWSKAYETGNVVVSALTDLYYNFTEDEKKNIAQILKEYSSSQTPLSGGGSGVVTTQSTATKVYVDDNGNEITGAQYLAKSPSDRKLYTEKTK